ncbi:MAG: Glu/Leu/Phe/Val dehydrogenase [Chloroflexi bacterium]|nr:Glu/Leu/Phe/Val dehydrogenase [Chloroflexota bacterium]
MAVFDQMAAMGHEEVIFHSDPASGLRAIVAIHSTALGPALGGARWHPYATEEEALEDVLRLASAMTAKAAVAGIDLGGGKAAVIGDPAAKTDAQIRAYARFVDGLGGRYITTTDVGTTTRDMDRIREETRYVVGLSAERGGGGDTSILTAQTVVAGMRAAMRFALGDESFRGRHVVVSGVGKVGARVARQAVAEGARVTVSDVRADAVRALAAEIRAEVVAPERAHAVECDVFSPNALGKVLTRRTILQLRCRVVCGGANNQLEEDPASASALAARGIVYAPDYVVNCGGLINAGVEWEGYDASRAHALADRVYDTTLDVLEEAQRRGISTAEAAALRVERRLAAARLAREAQRATA